ncbi:MAG TPA: HNH endonuclease [Deltaproteobacteria bacterium]|nr:HNH endonuclease [Deltaproteobacteria bacterium]
MAALRGKYIGAVCLAEALYVEVTKVPMRKTFPKDSVCKPCWELKYCPYGYLVEYFPLFHTSDTPDKFDIRERYEELLDEMKDNGARTPEEVHDYFRRMSILDPEANEYIAQYEPEDVACRIYGHTCPVFFHQSGASETKAYREEGRNISRKVMLQVVRRDGHICQKCRTNVPDDEIEFDHIIPVSKGGPSSVENLRVLCRACNRKKSDSLKEHLNY